MNTPVPYGKSNLDNSPLIKDGSDFPCKQRSGVYNAEGANNVMTLGSSQPLSFTGSATHGGGSCQISITYDQSPTKNSVFKVIHSIEGGCPIRGVAGNNGNSASAVDPSTYSFTVPENLPTGTATLAWTWFNKIGNREMYMNCAPVTITGSKSKRSEDELMARNVTQLLERDTAAYNALPDMFVANIGTGCGTQDSTDLLFPNPGNSVEQNGLATSALATPTGSACGAKIAGASPTAGSGSAPPASSASGLPGGVFATVAPLAPAQSPPAAVSPQVQSAPPASSPTAASQPASSSPSTQPSTGISGSGGVFAAGTACSTEGEWNCVGGTSFQQCASGTWSVVQQLAAGTKCTAGQSSAIDIVASSSKKRAVRFSNEHIRRHIQRSS